MTKKKSIGVKPCLLRDEKIHEAIMVHGYTLTALQKRLDLHPSTLSQIAKRSEGKRQDAKDKV